MLGAYSTKAVARMAQISAHFEHPFLPVWDSHSRVLVLGTFPSVASRVNAFYYGHPQNRFWRVLAALCDQPVPISVAQKKDFLLANGIAVWDVLASCDIAGSEDGSIRMPVPNDIGALLAKAPIQMVFTNGQTAGVLCRKFIAVQTGLPAVTLPSTSPANAACTLPMLIAAWQPLALCLTP